METLATCKKIKRSAVTLAKISHLMLLLQEKLGSADRMIKMVNQMDAEGFVQCSNTEACEVECLQYLDIGPAHHTDELSVQ